MTNRITPYARLIRECREWAFSVVFQKRFVMFVYPKGELTKGWRLDDVRERVIAANTLGWRCEVRVRENGDIAIEYVKAPPDAPLAIRP